MPKTFQTFRRWMVYDPDGIAIAVSMRADHMRARYAAATYLGRRWEDMEREGYVVILVEIGPVVEES